MLPVCDLPACLAAHQLSIVSAEPDNGLDRIAKTIAASVRVAGRAELEALFGALLAAAVPGAPIVPKTLDLLGHSTAQDAQIRIGDWVIDARHPTVTAFFRELAQHDVLGRLGIHAVRLLGCRTADSLPGRSTICALSDILGVEVYGTQHLLYDAHYDAHGFRDQWRFLLIGARELRRSTTEAAVAPEAARWPRTLDIDALPVVALEPNARWPIRIATPDAARAILSLVRRDAGARMPGLLATPSCAIALPSAVSDAYHVAHVLLDDGFLRFYPDGTDAPGVVYPVDDAQGLRRVLGTLTPAPFIR